ncbi:unnamed protein product [Cuscuta campestris]|uniref:Uncharacterized protein n=1 Tax=Cuscuta campestris TaxID=132261 RepID=A0A484K4N9_9ASTE|nr:unnamed protein product [Cuscuta campestris]
MGSRCVFPLTSLQIGDLQSYLSHLNLFLAHESNRLYILVDNRPWLKDLISRPAHLWQLMVTKSRMSPFANTRGKKGKRGTQTMQELQANPETKTRKSEKIKRWFSLVDAATLSKKRALLPVEKLRNSLILNSKLHRTLYGFIVFEVSWNDVRGLNYLNELQTDTCLAIEAKFMRRWEFDSASQASRCIPSWFRGTRTEQSILREYLESTTGDSFYDAEENFLRTSEVDGNVDDTFSRDEAPGCSSETIDNNPFCTPPPAGPYKRRSFLKSCARSDLFSEESFCESIGSPHCSHNNDSSESEDVVEATRYKDVLILFRFNDCHLPFKLKDIIMFDLRLLTLLESGLPSWAIFLQSYPGFCRLYRPWMCPLARFLYVIISVITVLIGFYDLYKNVPLLKATASHLFGPLFHWIETWEMISRIKCLGTMLFLHNFQKAVRWFIMMARTVQSFFSILAKPLLGPLLVGLDFILPFWNMCTELVGGCLSIIWMTLETSCSLVAEFLHIVFLPFWFLLSLFWNIATFLLNDVFWFIWEILYFPIRLVLGLYSLVAGICFFTYSVVQDAWVFLSSLLQFTSEVESTVTSYEPSMWRSLWNDLFSQIFRAVRSILNGFVAFFTTCNRHRLSIYNHTQGFIQKLSHPGKRIAIKDYSNRRQQLYLAQRMLEDEGVYKRERKSRKKKA